MADELKPCPFCGGEARMFYVDGWARPRCKCGANSGVLAGSDAEAIAAWNRRPSPAVGESETSRTIDDATPAELAACTFAQAPQAVVNDAVRECIDAIHASPGVTAGASDAELRCCGCGRETINRVKQCSCITNVGRGPGSPGTEWMRDPASAIVGKASGPTDPDQLRGFAAYCRSGVCIDKSDDDLLARKFEQAAVLVAERDAWKDVCRRAGVCMSCALGSPEPHGCFDCLNTGWEGGAPAGFVKEGAIASLSAEVERLTGYYAQVMSGQSVAIITRLETSERALSAEREAHERDVRQFSELADANRRRAEAAEADAQAMRAALERSARFVRDELDVRRASMIGPEGTADCPEDRAYIEDAQALLAQIEQALS